MEKQKERMYLAPAVKVVEFMVEQGFAFSPTVNQTGTENDGMNEQMNYDENNSLGYDWTTGY